MAAAIEDAAASAAEKRVATKKGISAIICNMPCRMAWYVEHAQRDIQFRQGDSVTLADTTIRKIQDIVSGSIDRNLSMLEQLLDAANMIIVAMRHEDSAQQQFVLLQIIEHRRGIAGIHDSRIMALRQQPDVVVAESAYRNNFHVCNHKRI